MKTIHKKATRQPNWLKPDTLATAVQRSLGVGGAALMLSISPFALSNGPIGAVLDVSELDGGNGFVLNGVDASDGSGISVSGAGDINSDGVADLIIGAFRASPNGNEIAGESYVVFGGSGVGSTGVVNLSDLSGTDGFVLNGVDAQDTTGYSVSGAGDINGDGVADLIIGAPARGVGSYETKGRSYVVFGGSGVGSTGVINLSDLSGTDGFVLNGVDLDDYSGQSVSGAGDINGDGLDDLAIGTYGASPNGNDLAGSVYVVFGGSGVGSVGAIDLSSLSGNDGFVLNGLDSGDRFGLSVSGAGDINGDGLHDLIIGAPGADPNGNRAAGESYVIFGGLGIGSTGLINLSELSGNDGFVLNGVGEISQFGSSVSGAGDINDDGVDDVIVGSFRGEQNGDGSAGSSYVVFGGNRVGSEGTINLSDLSGTDGFVLNSEFTNDGHSVSGAGDINGDGVDDLIIGAPATDLNRYGSAEASYVVFGGSEVGNTGAINLSDLNGTDGFVLYGKGTRNFFGYPVSGAGDINNDGLGDLILGAPGADPNGNPSAGESYVVFGNNIPVIPTGQAPDNDLFSNAAQLDGVSQALASGSTLTVNGTTSEATAQGNEPAHFQGGFGLPAGPLNSVWYRWTATANQVVEIDTKGSAVATVLAAYTGASLSTLRALAKGIDRVREVSRIRFATRAGETYHIAVDGYDNNSEGAIQLNIRQPTMDPSECTITGTNGPDVLTGTTGRDVICGLAGNDVIKSLGGADIIFAGSGSDFIGSGSGNDIVFGEDGSDVLVGGSGNDLLSGGLLADKLYGGSGNDIVFGSSGADRLFGGIGNDSLFGEMGGDRLFGGPGNDLLDGGPFNDVCLRSGGSDTLVGC